VRKEAFHGEASFFFMKKPVHVRFSGESSIFALAYRCMQTKTTEAVQVSILVPPHFTPPLGRVFNTLLI